MSLHDAAAAGKDIIGVGWHFPVRVDRGARPEERAVGRGTGGIALSRYDDDVDQAIRIILGTRPGERRMRPTFGCRVHELLFESLNATTFGLLQRYVTEALQMWEPRVDVVEVNVTTPTAPGWVDIEIQYRVRSTKDERTLVYPFYVIGEE